VGSRTDIEIWRRKSLDYLGSRNTVARSARFWGKKVKKYTFDFVLHMRFYG